MNAPADWLPDSALLTVGEVARLLRVSERALREWMHHKRDGYPVIPHVRLRRRVLIRRDWVESVLSENTQPPGGGPGLLHRKEATQTW